LISSTNDADTALAHDGATADKDLCWLAGLDYVILARRWNHGDFAGYTPVRVYEQTMTSLTGGQVPGTESETLARLIADGDLQELPNLSPSLAARLRDHELSADG